MSHPAARAPRRAAAQRAARASFALLLLPILVAVFAVSILRPFHGHFELLLPALGVASVAWLGAVAIARTGAGDLRVVVVGAIALRLLALAGGPELSDDVYRYAWEGELVASGVSPYAHAPDAPELEVWRAARPELFERLNHPEVSAAYPPLAQGVFAAAWVAADALGAGDWWTVVSLLRGLFALCDLLVLVPLVLLLRRRGQPEGLAVAWGWSPLVAVEFAGSGHFDSLGILLLVGALALHPVAARRAPVPGARELGALALLAAGTLVKLLPLCAAPFLARGRGVWLRLGLFALLVAVGFAPFVWGLAGGGAGLGRGLAEYGLRWEHSGLAHGHLEALLRWSGLANDGSLLDVRRVGRALVLAAWGALALDLLRRRVGAPEASGVLVGAFLVFTPTLHPWYLAWVLPFLALRPRASFLWLAASGVLLYWAPVQQALGAGYQVPLPYRVAIAAPFWFLLLVELASLRRAGPGAAPG